MTLLRVTHATTFRHASPVPASWQMARLRPADTTGQTCLSFDLDIRPATGDLRERTDYFGNRLHLFSVSEPHTELDVTATSLVRRDDIARPPASAFPSLSQCAERAAGACDPTIEQFRHPTTAAPALPSTRQLADGLDPADPALVWIGALGERFRRELTFDPTATSVSTPLAVMIEQRRGVCQDFAHAFVSCARQWGLAVAYVSGYLLTEPPPGQPRLLGADAMHAWVSVHVPGHGWIDYDPTNTCFADTRYVTVARGRDYADVSPIRGFFRGGSSYALLIGVTVEPFEATIDAT